MNILYGGGLPDDYAVDVSGLTPIIKGDVMAGKTWNEQPPEQAKVFDLRGQETLLRVKFRSNGGDRSTVSMDYYDGGGVLTKVMFAAEARAMAEWILSVTGKVSGGEGPYEPGSKAEADYVNRKYPDKGPKIDHTTPTGTLQDAIAESENHEMAREIWCKHCDRWVLCYGDLHSHKNDIHLEEYEKLKGFKIDGTVKAMDVHEKYPYTEQKAIPAVDDVLGHEGYPYANRTFAEDGNKRSDDTITLGEKLRGGK